MLIRSTTKEKETYMLKIQNYVRAKSLEEAWQLNQNKRNRVIGGMMWMKMSNNAIGTAIDLCDLGLDKILITCIDDNIGSEKVILNNGGVYESTVNEPDMKRNLKRFWITL